MASVATAPVEPSEQPEFLEPVTPSSVSDGNQSCSPPPYSAHQVNNFYNQNNNYMPYQDEEPQPIQKDQQLSYTWDFAYQSPTATQPQVYQEHSPLSEAGQPRPQQSLNSDYEPTTTSANSTPLQRGPNVSQKRARTQFTSLQLVEMEREFTDGRYLSRAKRIHLAQKLNLTEKQIKVWFQNRRMKFNRDNKMKNSSPGKHSKALSPESSCSSMDSPGMERPDVNRFSRHSPLIKTQFEYTPPLNNNGLYQGFGSSQWNESSVYSPGTYHHPPVYSSGVTHQTLPTDSSSTYSNYSSFYNNYYSNSTAPYSSRFSAALPQHSSQQDASKSAFQIVPQQVKKEDFVEHFNHQKTSEYTPNVTVTWGPSGSMIELQELK